MRTAAAGILVCGLAAGCRPVPSDSRPAETTAPSVRPAQALQCDPAAIVRITLGANQFHPRGAGRCDVMSIEPDPVIACAGGTITWEFENGCSRSVKAKIGKRKPKYPKDTQAEPLTTTNDLKTSPYPVPANGSAQLTATVSPSAKPNRYKYDIAGDDDIATDPEIDVRRGGIRGSPTPPPQRMPSPSSVPSPDGKR